jgi:hypothetical protein
LTELIKYTLEIGTDGGGKVLINPPDLQPDKNGVGHIVLSPEQARELAFLLQKKASSADVEVIEKRQQKAAKFPVEMERKCQMN